MGFSTDEQLLNSITLESALEYRDYIKQLKPLLLQEAGYIETPGKNLGFKGAQDAADQIINRGFSAGQSVIDIANRLGVSASDIQAVEKLVGEYNAPATDYARKIEIDKQIQGMTSSRTGFEKTPEAKALEERFKKLEEQQLSLTEAQLARQTKALKGEMPNSDTLMKSIQSDFQKFKEAQARAGNIIMGDDPLTAVAKGTAATEALQAFQDNATQAKEREIQSIISETPFAYGGFELSQGSAGKRAYALPNAPDYGGMSSMALSSYQPFQFNRQMDFQQQQLQNSNSQAKKNRQSQLLAGALGLGASAAMMFAPTPKFNSGVR